MGKNQGGICRCEGCGERFNGMRAFDMHRIGEYGRGRRPSTRRCLSAAEMRARGMAKSDRRGAWMTGSEYRGERASA
ncbi:MAG TPA: hypothetical protein VF120_01710 [Ktedonobacterales bacterium]